VGSLSHWLGLLGVVNPPQLDCSRGIDDTSITFLPLTNSRFYDLDAGQLLINGVDIKDIDITVARKQFSLVSQEPTLYQGTSIRQSLVKLLLSDT
jgi:ATP-binding cassette, subfamily B, multidrug efflux pump